MIEKKLIKTRLKASLIHPSVRHLVGFPSELEGEKTPVLMASASELTIVENDDGIFLNRYSSAGCLVGDTWHQSVEEAMEQAKFEFGELLDEWEPV